MNQRTNGSVTASLTDTFHRLSRILPDNQRLITVEPEMTAREAFDLMEKHGYSQLPVKVGDTVIGMFSYRSFAREIIKLGKSLLEEELNLEDIEVEELMDRAPSFAIISDDFSKWFDDLDQKDAILIGRKDDIRGLLTTIDILHYLYKVASPFVLLAEIELTLRNLILVSVSEEKLTELIEAAETRTKKWEKFTFGSYVQLITHDDTWPFFHPTFRGSQNGTKTKLKGINELRNKAFHFDGEISVKEYDKLVEWRDWIHKKSERAELRTNMKGGVGNE